MKILRVKITNYRNLNDLDIFFDPDINFIVGETSVGKTNLLSLFHTIFNWRSFYESDFQDPTIPISLEFEISLNELQKGHFEDLFSPDNSNNINILAIQDSPDEVIQFFHKESGTSISPSLMKRINYIYYDSQRNPGSELSFDKRKGVGKFLNHLYSKYLESHEVDDIDFINKSELEGLLGYINANLIKIKSFKDFSIKANTDEDVRNLLARIINLRDDQNFELQRSGYGLQFASMISLAILEKLLGKNVSKDKYFFEDENGLKFSSMIIGLDEPEIHLHPYMQRSLVRYLLKLIQNKDAEFIELISELFSFNGFIGQIIISTHSPNILLSSYKQIIHLYRDRDNNILSKNGTKIDLDPKIEKHLGKNMPYIKEAFFSRCVVLVEGDTEVGALPEFAIKLNIDLDDAGISIIQAGSADSIPPLMKLLDEFGILCISIMDGDKKSATYASIENLYFTDQHDFEEEVVKKCFDRSSVDLLFQIVKENDSNQENRVIQKQKLNNTIRKYALDLAEVNIDYAFTEDNPDILYALYLSWLDINKSILLGKTIGQALDKDNIPNAFKNMLIEAERLSQDAQ
ncbi:AAA family ATPase [candidate division KSB1 bacterium]|nr:AAA family ATPase [candidate division KSB1 bacterium]